MSTERHHFTVARQPSSDLPLPVLLSRLEEVLHRANVARYVGEEFTDEWVGMQAAWCHVSTAAMWNFLFDASHAGMLISASS